MGFFAGIFRQFDQVVNRSILDLQPLTQLLQHRFRFARLECLIRSSHFHHERCRGERKIPLVTRFSLNCSRGLSRSCASFALKALASKGGGPLRLPSMVTVTTDDAMKEQCSSELIHMDYKNLPKVMAVGQSIMVDDGLIELMVESIDVGAGTMVCKVANAGKLGGKKGCNLPEVDVDLPALSELLRNHLGLRSIGVIEAEPMSRMERTFHLDARGKESIGRALLGSASHQIRFVQCDVFSLTPQTKTLVWKTSSQSDAVMLAGVLKFNSSLKVLGLQETGFDDTAAGYFYTALLENKTLEHLDDAWSVQNDDGSFPSSSPRSPARPKIRKTSPEVPQALERYELSQGDAWVTRVTLRHAAAITRRRRRSRLPSRPCWFRGRDTCPAC